MMHLRRHHMESGAERKHWCQLVGWGCLLPTFTCVQTGRDPAVYLGVDQCRGNGAGCSNAEQSARPNLPGDQRLVKRGCYIKHVLHTGYKRLVKQCGCVKDLTWLTYRRPGSHSTCLTADMVGSSSISERSAVNDSESNTFMRLKRVCVLAQ